MVCRECGNEFGSSVVIDGKERNLQNRKFCLVCSPFGSHNTKSRLNTGTSICCACKDELPNEEFNKKGKRRASRCKSCLYLYQMRRWNRRKIRAVEHMGGECKECHTTGEHPAQFEFHHVGEKDDMWTTLRQKSWDKIVEELKKCEMLCCMCHRKVHVNPNLWPDEFKGIGGFPRDF